MVTSLLKYERIRTTNTKAKELRRWADHIITLAKRGDLHARRQALSIVREKAVVHKLFEEADQRFGASAGGYTRVTKLGRRAGDAAPISLVELVISEPKSKKKKATKKTSRKKVAEEPEQAKPEVKAKRTTTKKETTDKKETQPQPKAKPAAKKPKTAAKKAEKTETKSKPAADGKSEAKAESKSKPATKKKPSADK
jgi:large subunit ribosomal protein L17